MTNKSTYEFGPFRLDSAEYVLSRDGEVVPLTPKVFETLLVLVENSGHVVGKEELYKQVWGDSFVEETNLTKNISILRKILDGDDAKTSFIETVPKRGYRFAARVQESRAKGGENGSSYVTTLDSANEVESTAPSSVRQSPSAPYVVVGIKQHKIAVLLALLVLVGGTAGLSLYLRSRGTADAIESVAVMPFVNDSGDPEIDYLADGMTETLINGLAQIPSLSVKGRSTVFRYKGREFSAPMIGKELGVQTILLGRLVKRADQLTLNVELIDTATENVLWGNRYERAHTDLVKLQGDLGRDVSKHLRSSLSGAEEAKVTEVHTTDPKAFEMYLKGRYFDNKRTPESVEKAVEAFSHAVTLDPTYALAYAGLADAYSHGPTRSISFDESRTKAAENARRALQIDDSLAAAHNSIANLKFFYEWDLAGAGHEFERAIELDPNDALICWNYSQFLALLGDSEGAIKWGRRAKMLAPLDGSSGLAQAFILAGRYDEALEETRETLELDDEYYWSHYWRGISYTEKGLYDEAIPALEKAVEITDSSDFRGALANSLARAGRRAEAERIVAELIPTAKGKSGSKSSVAIAYAGLGDKELAFQWLDRSFEARDDEAILYLKTHPMFAPLRDDPRFKELLRKLNLS